MLFARLSLVAFASTLISTVAGLNIIVPGGSTLWWVSATENNIIWNCSDTTYDQFNVLLANSNPSVLAAPLPIIATLPNYICSKLISKTLLSVPAATGYTIQFSNIYNNTDLYATSQPFEIKAAGSAYPDASATPSSGGSSGTPSSTGSGSSPSNSAGGNNSGGKNGGSKNVLSAFGAFAAIVVGVMTA